MVKTLKRRSKNNKKHKGKQQRTLKKISSFKQFEKEGTNSLRESIVKVQFVTI